MTSERTGKVQTVLGMIDPAELGATMHHEHALIDQGCYFEMSDEATERWHIGRPFTMEMRGDIGNHWAWNRTTWRTGPSSRSPTRSSGTSPSVSVRRG